MAEIIFHPLHDKPYQYWHERKWREWQSSKARMATEAEAMNEWGRIFTEGGFFVEREVSGRHLTGKGVRIDMLLHPSGFTWADGSRMPIGFECKKMSGKVTNAFAQAADYTHSDFYSDHLGAMVKTPYVAIYTGPIDQEFAIAMGQVHVLNIQFRSYYGLCICRGKQRIWSQPGYVDQIPKVFFSEVKSKETNGWTRVGHRA
jgi:hypothetical protein